MKISKIYYYSFQPVLVLLGLTVIRYLMGDRGIFNTERFFICIIGGLLLGTIFMLIDTFKNRKRRSIM